MDEQKTAVLEMKFGKYRVVRELGKGAMGVVYLAFDPVLDRHVAVKTISSALADDSLRERFVREARSAARLHHPNIITIFDMAAEEDRLYIAMEYLEGRDLDEIIAGAVRLDIKTKLEIVRQICLGLDCAHRQNVLHRDVKPANIKLLSDGTVRIMDFGLAVIHSSTLTHSSMLFGTPSYIAPERIRGEAIDGRSDQFAVGLILYELLTYRRPFEAETIPQVLYNIINREPPGLEPAVTEQYPELEHIIRRACHKDPQQRYPSMQVMADEIAGLLQRMREENFTRTAPLALTAQPITTTAIEGRRRRLPPHLRPWIYGAAAAVLVVLGFLAYRLAFAPRAPGGVLVFDARPYAVLEGLHNDADGRPLAVPPGQAVTPLRLTLAAGRYRLSFRLAGSRDVIHRLVTIRANAVTVENAAAGGEWSQAAAAHFALPMPEIPRENNE